MLLKMVDNNVCVAETELKHAKTVTVFQVCDYGYKYVIFYFTHILHKFLLNAKHSVYTFHKQSECRLLTL